MGIKNGNDNVTEIVRVTAVRTRSWKRTPHQCSMVLLVMLELRKQSQNVLRHEVMPRQNPNNGRPLQENRVQVSEHH